MNKCYNTECLNYTDADRDNCNHWQSRYMIDCPKHRSSSWQYETLKVISGLRLMYDSIYNPDQPKKEVLEELYTELTKKWNYKIFDYNKK